MPHSTATKLVLINQTKPHRLKKSIQRDSLLWVGCIRLKTPTKNLQLWNKVQNSFRFSFVVKWCIDKNGRDNGPAWLSWWLFMIYFK